MSRRKRLSVVATTALVAAFPVSPLFADETPSPQNESTQAVATDVFVDPFAGFDETLLNVPDGETAAFYRERAAALDEEGKRVNAEFAKNRPQTASKRAALLGRVLYGEELKPAPVGSVSARVAAAFARVQRQLSEASKLTPEERREAFVLYFFVAGVGADDGEAAEAFFSKLLAEEETKTTPDLARVLHLHQAIEIAIATRRQDDRDQALPSDVEQLLDVPEGERVEFYRARRGALIRAFRRFPNESARLSNASVVVDRRVAYAADATPTERFAAFARYVDSLVKAAQLDELRALAEREAKNAADAKNVADAARAPYVELATTNARLRRLEKDAKGLQVKLSEDVKNELKQIAAEVAERADDGSLPWNPEFSWAKFAQGYAIRFEQFDRDAATQLRKAVVAKLAKSENEAIKTVCQELSDKIFADEILGAALPFEATNLDGTPFDWDAYRGSPTLIEILSPNRKGKIARVYALSVNPNKFKEAGLRRIIVVAASPEAARQFREAPENAEVADIPLAVAKPDGWTRRLGFIPTKSHAFLLVDAAGRVLAGSGPIPLNDPNAPEIVDKLLELFPNVAPKAQ